jgi:hypothetical protein
MIDDEIAKRINRLRWLEERAHFYSERRQSLARGLRCAAMEMAIDAKYWSLMEHLRGYADW